MDFYRVLYDHAKDAHFIMDDRGIFDCNQAAVELLGCQSKAEVLHLHPATLSPERQPSGELSRELAQKMDALTRQNGWHRFEWYHQKVSGEIFPVEVTLNEIQIEGRPYTLGVWHDLTAIKLRENQLVALNAELQKTNERMREDLEAAAEVQRALLPGMDLHLPQLSAAWVYQPSETLGGDQLNIFHLDEEAIGFYCLDVTGHGVSAALLAVSAGHLLSPLTENSLVKNRQGEIVPPQEVLLQLNRQFLWKSGKPRFLTILYGVVYPREKRVVYATAGSPGPLWLRQGHELQHLDRPGFAIGMLPQATYEQVELTLAEGDRFILYSDGVTEAQSPEGVFFEKERLAETLTGLSAQTLAEQVHGVQTALQAWCQRERPRDDVSLLAFSLGP